MTSVKQAKSKSLDKAENTLLQVEFAMPYLSGKDKSQSLITNWLIFLISYSPKYGIKYFDTTKDREKVLNEVVDFISKEIE